MNTTASTDSPPRAGRLFTEGADSEVDMGPDPEVVAMRRLEWARDMRERLRRSGSSSGPPVEIGSGYLSRYIDAVADVGSTWDIYLRRRLATAGSPDEEEFLRMADLLLAAYWEQHDSIEFYESRRGLPPYRLVIDAIENDLQFRRHAVRYAVDQGIRMLATRPLDLATDTARAAVVRHLELESEYRLYTCPDDRLRTIAIGVDSLVARLARAGDGVWRAIVDDGWDRAGSEERSRRIVTETM